MLKFVIGLAVPELRERSNIIWRFEGGAQTRQECRHMGGRGWPNRHLTFIVAKKA